MLITGMAAGFGGLFQTPLAAVFFAMEVGVSGYVEYDTLLPALIASYTASTTSHLLGLEKFSVDLQEIWKIGDVKNAGILVILGLAFGLNRAVFFCTFAEDEEAGRRQNQQSTGTDRLSCDPSCGYIAGITQCKI